MDQAANALCSICFEKEQRYTCPRCNVYYCSLACYQHQKHSGCSESFYKDWFIKEMKERRVTVAEKQAILETIQKVEDENPIVDFLHEDASLEDRLQNIDINNLSDEKVDQVWDQLTTAEREEFKKFAESGLFHADQNLSKAWIPWWKTHNKGLIAEIGGAEIKRSESLPKILKVPPFTYLSAGRPPSPLIGCNLINILYSYVFFQRLYNGCGPSEFASDFCELCILSSDVLKENRTYDDADESVSSCMQKCVETARHHEFNVKKQFPVECMQDMSHILVGPSLQSSHEYVACILSDLHSVLKKFRKSVKASPLSNKSSSKLSDTTDLPRRLFAIMKKLEYLISWCSCHREPLALLAIEITEIYKKKLERLKDDIVAEQAIKARSKKRNPIEKSKQCNGPKIVELN